MRASRAAAEIDAEVAHVAEDRKSRVIGMTPDAPSADQRAKGVRKMLIQPAAQPALQDSVRAAAALPSPRDMTPGRVMRPATLAALADALNGAAQAPMSSEIHMATVNPFEGVG